MKLIKQIKVNKYKVIADYKVKVKQSPFMAVLQLALENEDMITPTFLYNELLKPLSVRGCENLLDRLTSMGYFISKKQNNLNRLEDEDYFMNSTEEETTYSLTQLGEKSIQTNDFYDKRNGLLEIWVAKENKFTLQRIIKISELKSDYDSDTKTQEINLELNSLQNSQNIINLNNGASFTIDNIKNQIKHIERGTEQLIIIPENKNTSIKLADFIEYKKHKKQDILKEILSNEYTENYIAEKNTILINYNPEDLSMVRNKIIDEPVFQVTTFNKISIPNCKVSPNSLKDAKEWYLALLKKRLNKYFLSDKEFKDYANKIASEFEIYGDDLQNTINRVDLINSLTQKNEFYKKAKLETIDYLNY